MKQITIVWLLGGDNDISQFENVHQHTRANVTYFYDADKCTDYITQDKPDEKCILVVYEYSSSKFLLTVLHEFSQVASIYLVRPLEEETTQEYEWAQEYAKVKAVCHSVKELYDRIGQELDIQKQRLCDPLSIGIYKHEDTESITTTDLVSTAATPSPIPTIFNRTEQTSTSDLRTENGNFLWFQLFIEVLIRMKYQQEQGKLNFIEHCRCIYRDNNQELRKLELLNRTYSPGHAIKWYTSDTCLFRLLNEALRFKNVELLILFRWFISDIYQHLLRENTIQNASNDEKLIVYRGQQLGRTEFERLQNSKGEFLSINSFLSTSVDRQVALVFAGISTDNSIATLIEIIIENNVKNLKPYANISHLSDFDAEKEILFMLGSVFRIGNIVFNVEDNIWVISLTLGNENDQDYKQVFEHEERTLVGENPTYYHLAELFYRIGDYDQSEKYFNLHLNVCTTSHDVMLCHAGLSKVNTRKDKSDLRQKHFMQAAEILRDQEKAITDPKLRHELVTKAIKWLHGDNDSDICIQRAQACMQNKRDDLAITHYTKALNIQKKQLPSDHPDIGRTLHSMGHCFAALKSYEQALQYMTQALEIRKKSLPANHRDLALSYSSLGSLYSILMENDLALEYYTKAREIHYASAKPDQLDLWVIDTSIKRIQTSTTSASSFST